MKCSVKGCYGTYECKGYCSKHYQRFMKYGDPLYTTRKPKGYWDGVFCKEEGCTNEVSSKELCKLHVTRARRAASKAVIAAYIEKREGEK